MKRVFWVIFILVLTAFSIWLFGSEEAAQPGMLRTVHAESASCEDCHTPWRGVDNAACLNCHSFYAAGEDLPRKIRFHETDELCLDCHTEHRGSVASISTMDHTLLHPDLLCSTCHFDPHERLFGENCRACHGISDWEVPGYRHPPVERGNCARCHRPPLSHQDRRFWQRLEERHQLKIGEDAEVKPRECGKCHVPHSWSHLRM